MAKRRANSNSSARDGYDKVASVAAEPSGSSPPVVLITTLFLILAVIYWVLFYRAELVGGIPRFQLLGSVLVPDQVFVDWCGGESGQVAILDRVPILAVAAGVWGASFVLGWLVLTLLRLELQLDRLEFVTLAIGVGLSGVSLITLVAGLAGGLQDRRWLVIAAMLLLVACAWLTRRAMLSRAEDRNLESNRPTPQMWSSIWSPQWWWMGIPFAAVLLLGGALPPLDFDVLEYHLQVPKEWYQQGQITFLPHNVYGNMPLGSELLATLAMALMPGEMSWWWGALAGKVLMAGFGPLTAVLLFAAGRRCYSRQVGLVASLVYISTAWVAVVSVSGLNEGVVAFYLFAAAYVLYLCLRPTDDRHPYGLLTLAGLLAGSAAACKYTSVLFVVIPLFLVVLWQQRIMRPRAVAIFLTALFVASGLWYAKNWVLAGNPTYPLLVSVFGGETRDAERDAQWRQAHAVPRDADGRRYSAAQLGGATLQLLGRSAWLNPMIVPFIGCLLLCWRRYREFLYWAAGLLFILGSWWLFTHRLERFWVPAIPLMALLAGIGSDWSDSRIWRRVVWSVTAISLVANFVTITSAPLAGDNRYFVALEQLRDDPELSLEMPAHRYLNAAVRPGSRALLVGDAAVFNLRVPIWYSTCFDESLFEQILKGKTRAERRARLVELQVSHIFVNWAEIRRYRQPGNYGFSDFVTFELVHDELAKEQRLIRSVDVPGLDVERGEIFEVMR